jgi:hypothetical protein
MENRASFRNLMAMNVETEEEGVMQGKGKGMDKGTCVIPVTNLVHYECDLWGRDTKEVERKEW